MLQAQLLKEAMSQGGGESKPFEPPYDTQLVKYLEEVVEKIQPISSVREQVILLAE